MLFNCTRLFCKSFLNVVRCRRFSKFPQINVSAEPSLFDERIHLSVQGLCPSSVVTIYAKTDVASDCFYESFANYKVSTKGDVNLARDECLLGSYDGVDPMGLFWSMTSFSTSQDKVKRFIKTDVTKPQIYHLQVFDDAKYSLDECRSTKQSKSIASTMLNRWFVAPGVRRIPVRENGIIGTLFLPPGEGPFPGLINLFGGYPGVLEYKSALHASHGFASLALAYISLEGLPPTVFSLIDLSYFEKAVDFMKQNESIEGANGIGVVGLCKGASLAVAMATYLKDIRCVVAMNGSCLSLAGTLMYRDKHWDVDLLDYSKLRPGRDNNMIDIFVYPEGVEFEDHPNFFPFHKQHHVSYMLVSGLDDKCIPPIFIDEMERMLRDEQHPDFQVFKYPGAGHLIEPPYFPFLSSFYQPGDPMNVHLATGGALVPHCKAQLDCWPKTFEFLRERLMPKR